MNDIERSNQNTKINLRNQKFIIFAEDLYDLTPNEILSVFQNVSKKSLAELCLFDLALFNEEPLTSAGGVYLFFSLDNACFSVRDKKKRQGLQKVAERGFD